jgi:hypothetical protein
MSAPIKKTIYGKVFGVGTPSSQFECADPAYIKSITTTGTDKLTSLQFTCSDGTKSPVWGTATGTPTTYDYSRANYNIQGFYGTIGAGDLAKFGFLNNESNPDSATSMRQYPPFGAVTTPSDMVFACPIEGNGLTASLSGLSVGMTTSGITSIAGGCSLIACPPGSTYNSSANTCETIVVPIRTCPDGYTLSRMGCIPNSSLTPDVIKQTTDAQSAYAALQQAQLADWATQQQTQLGALTGSSTGSAVGGSASSSTGAGGLSQGVTADTGASNWMLFIVFVIVLALAAVGVYMWRKRQAKKAISPPAV